MLARTIDAGPGQHHLQQFVVAQTLDALAGRPTAKRVDPAWVGVLETQCAERPFGKARVEIAVADRGR